MTHGALLASSPAGEREVVAMLAEGETNARIAQRLVVSEDTVKTHVKHILRKLGVRNRSQAVSRYFRTRGGTAPPLAGGRKRCPFWEAEITPWPDAPEGKRGLGSLGRHASAFPKRRRVSRTE